MRMDRRHKGLLSGLAVFLTVTGVLLIALPFAVQALSSHAGGAAQPKAAKSGGTSQSAVRSRKTTSSQITTDVAAPSAPAQPTSPSVPATAAAPTVADVGVALPAITPRVIVPATALSAATPAGPSLDAYRGLGSWVDIYDDRAWGDPGAAVADMASHGVRTLYVETSNSSSSFALKDSSALSAFIRTAHAHGMLVVAWYLPDMTSVSTDYIRIAQAIGFHTSDGQKFDSFALDIESSAISSEADRNSALTSLSSRIRSLVGTSYTLGAIIPSPTGLAKKMGYWDTFPYAMVAQKYNVFVPMSYYSYHGSGSSAAYADTVSNVRILRAQNGCSKMPIHLIGGLAENSSTSEVHSFVRGAVENHCIGASLYGWAGTTSGDWQELKAIKP